MDSYNVRILLSRAFLRLLIGFKELFFNSTRKKGMDNDYLAYFIASVLHYKNNKDQKAVVMKKVVIDHRI